MRLLRRARFYAAYALRILRYAATRAMLRLIFSHLFFFAAFFSLLDYAAATWFMLSDEHAAAAAELSWRRCRH